MILWLMKWLIRRVQRRAEWRNIKRVRRGFDKLTRRFDMRSKKCRYEPFLIDRMKAEWIIPFSNPDTDRVLLYLHGGGYAAGSIDTHRSHISQIARLSGFRVLMIDYRLAPENKFPAAVEDGVKAYDWLLASGYNPERLAIGGDSAGGGLTAATLLYLRDHYRALPKCAILLSPWLDLTQSGESQNSKEHEEPMLVKEALPVWAAYYLGDADPKTPYASPLFGDLHGLPPMYIQVGTSELLYDDSIRFEKKAKEAGVKVTMDIYHKHFHVFQAFFMILRSARKANRKLAEYIVSQIGA